MEFEVIVHIGVVLVYRLCCIVVEGQGIEHQYFLSTE